MLVRRGDIARVIHRTRLRAGKFFPLLRFGGHLLGQFFYSCRFTAAFAGAMLLTPLGVPHFLWRMF